MGVTGVWLSVAAAQTAMAVLSVLLLRKFRGSADGAIGAPVS